MKAILIVDMPESCADCRFCDYNDSIKSSFCTANPSHMFKMNEIGGVYSMRRDFCCPLKPMPQKNKYDVEKYTTVDYKNNVTLGHYLNKGWNECLEEIEK